MTVVNPTTDPGAPCHAAVDAALLVLGQMGLSPADLVAVPVAQPQLPTFAEYVPVVSAAVTAGTRRAYGSYWNRIIEQRGGRRLDEPSPSQIRQLMVHVKTHVVARRARWPSRGACPPPAGPSRTPACWSAPPAWPEKIDHARPIAHRLAATGKPCHGEPFAAAA